MTNPRIATLSLLAAHGPDWPAHDSPKNGPTAASIFDKRVSAELGLARFGLYQVDLPPWATTEPHDHVQDEVEDAYAVIRGNGWVIVDGQEVRIEAGQFVGVTKESNRFIRAGKDGCVLIAVCA